MSLQPLHPNNAPPIHQLQQHFSSQTSTSNRPVPKLHNGRTFEGEHVLNLAAVVESCGGDALLDVFQRAAPFLGKLRQIQVVGLTCLLRVE